MERVGRVTTVCRWVDQRPEDVEELDHRARPTVRDDQRQRVGVRRPRVDEVEVLAVDLGLELRP